LGKGYGIKCGTIGNNLWSLWELDEKNGELCKNTIGKKKKKKKHGEN